MFCRRQIIASVLASLVAIEGCAGASSGTSLPSLGKSNGAEAQFAGGASSAPPPPPERVSPDQLYGGLTIGGKALDPSLILEERMQKLGNRGFADFLDAVESRVVNNTVTIDGVMQVSQVKSRFQVMMPKMRALAIKWVSFGNFWRAQSLNPKVIISTDIERYVGRAFRYLNAPERQAQPSAEQQALQDEIDRLNEERSRDTVSREENSNCDKYNQPKCTPDPIVMEPIKPDQISFESCKLPSGLQLKHECTMAAAIGGALMSADRRLESLGAVIAAAALICLVESTAPVAPSCSPNNTFSKDPSF